MSYALLDREGPYPWPAIGEGNSAALALMLQQLTEQPLEDVLQRTRPGGELANKEVDVADLAEEAQQRFDFVTAQLNPDMNLWIYEFTYCYRVGDPRRVWAAYDSDFRRAYPIWWDPDHKVCGYSAQFAARYTGGGQCAPNCPHPPGL